MEAAGLAASLSSWGGTGAGCRKTISSAVKITWGKMDFCHIRVWLFPFLVKRCRQEAVGVKERLVSRDAEGLDASSRPRAAEFLAGRIRIAECQRKQLECKQSGFPEPTATLPSVLVEKLGAASLGHAVRCATGHSGQDKPPHLLSKQERASLTLVSRTGLCHAL